MRSKKRNVGDVVKISLSDSTHMYARVLQEAFFAIYDCRVADELAVEQVVDRPVVAVMHHAVKKGRGRSLVTPHSATASVVLRPLRKTLTGAYKFLWEDRGFGRPL